MTASTCCGRNRARRPRGCRGGPGAETKLAAAAEAFLAEVGTFADALDALDALDANVDPAAEAAFLEKLTTQCPILAALLEPQ